jgi:hypothetical protein
MFDVEYGRWLEEHHRLVCELRAAVDEHLHENELRLYVENCLAHYDQVINLKALLARTDVFHLVYGMWKTPAERCFMWIGGFRPSELIKVHNVTPYKKKREDKLLLIVEPFLYGPKKVIFSKIVDFFII